MLGIHDIKIDLDPEWHKTAKIPETYKNANIAKIQGDGQKYTARYLDNIPKMVSDGVGMFIYGKEGVGKSSMAAVIARAAAQYRFTVTRFTFGEAQSTKIDDRTEYNADGQFINDRLHTVDFLILDDFDHDFIDDRVFGASRVRRLIAARSTARKATFLTSRIQPKDVTGSDSRIVNKQLFIELHHQMKGSMVSVLIEGENYYESRNSELRRIFE